MLTRRNRRRHRGAALMTFVATLMLLIAGIGAASVHFLLTGRQLASHQLDREIAFRAAEAALRDAEADLIAATASSSDRLSAWPAPGTCGSGPQAGICRADDDGRAWQSWLDGAASDSAGIPLGSITGATLPELPADVIGATTLPRYLIELSDDPDSPAAGMWPRMAIVALGIGRDPSIRVVLQTEFQP